MNADFSLVCLENSMQNLIENRESCDLTPDISKLVDDVLDHCRMVLALKTDVNTSGTDAPTDADTIRGEADALVNVSADVRDTMRSHADILDSIGSEGNARQLVRHLVHDYYDLAHLLDECEESDAMHHAMWSKADADFWNYKFNRYTTQISSASSDIADALDMLRDMLDSLNADSHIDPDAMPDAYGTLDAINAKSDDILDLVRRLESIPKA